MLRLLTIPAVLFALAACGSSEPPPPSVEEIAAQKCPRVHMDKLAGDWISATGDPKTRFRIVEQGGETIAWYIDPAYSNHKLELVGTRRDKDWQFDERPRGQRKMLVEEGGEALKRLYVAPKMQACAVEVYPGMVDKDGKESMPPRPKEFLEFPETTEVVFSYRPYDETLFAGPAAASKAAADKHLAEHGRPLGLAPTGDVTVAIWTAPEADGDAACTYTYDAYFDHQALPDAKDQPAGEVQDGVRAWSHTFRAPYLGGHSFELFRYRTCDGAKTLIAVAGADVVLE